MINVNNFKPNITFKLNNDPYVVLESQHSQQGRGQASVKAKIKNLLTGAIISKTFTGGDKVEQAFITKEKMMFLYKDETDIYLMNQTTFDQITIDIKKVKWELNFLAESSEILVRSFEGTILGVEIDLNVNLKITEAPDGAKGNSVSNPQKRAMLETGFEINVPLFIKVGDVISVSTQSGKYLGKREK